MLAAPLTPELATIIDNIVANSEPLGPEFEKVWAENHDVLYETDGLAERGRVPVNWNVFGEKFQALFHDKVADSTKTARIYPIYEGDTVTVIEISLFPTVTVSEEEELAARATIQYLCRDYQRYHIRNASEYPGTTCRDLLVEIVL